MINRLKKIAAIDLKQMGNKVELMEGSVDENCKDEFMKIIDKYLNPIDPSGDLTIEECVQKLNNQMAQNMMDELLELSYNE